MKNTRFNPFATAIAAAGILTLASSIANAGTITWDDVNATTNLWDTPGAASLNWIGGVAPSAGDDVVVTSDGAFDPTNNSSFTGTPINSLTLTSTGANGSLALNSTVQVGAGGIYNNLPASGSLNLNGGANLTADSTWGGTRTIFIGGGGITGAKMIWDGSGNRFDVNSPTWTAGMDVHGLVAMNDLASEVGNTITHWGTGPLTLINQKLNLANVTSGLSFAFAPGNLDLATAVTFANDIVLQDPGTGNFDISQNANSAALAGGHFVKFTGTISGAVNTARTLSFRNSQGVGTPLTYVLEGANTHTAKTVMSTDYLTVALGNVNALQNSTLDTGLLDATRAVTFTVPGTNTYNLGGLTGADDLDFGANSLSVGSNGEGGIFEGALAGTGNFTKIGAGTIRLFGINTYSGTTTVTEGSLVAAYPDSLSGYNTPGKVVFDGGTIGATMGGGGWTDTDLSTLLSNATKNSGFVGIDTFFGAYTQTAPYTAADFGSLGLSVTGGDSLTLNQANTYAGGTTFVGNTLTVGASGALGSGAVTGLDNAVLSFNAAADVTIGNPISIAVPEDNGFVNLSDTSTVTLNGTVDITANNYQAFIGTGADNAGFVLGSSANVTMSARLALVDTNLTINAGAVLNPFFKRIALGESGGYGSAIYLGDGATLGLKVVDANTKNAPEYQIFTLGMNTAGSSTYIGDGAGNAVDLHLRSTSGIGSTWDFKAVTGATVTIAGKILNSGTNDAPPVTKTGAGTVVFSGINSYTGPTTVAEGTLALAAGSQASPISLNDGAFLGFTVGSSITSSAAVDLATSTDQIKISGTPTLASYTLITASSITGTATLASPVAGYTLVQDATTLKLNKTGGAGDYATWATANGIPGQPASGDYDFDGLSNLMEYGLGTNPTVSSQPPGSFTGGVVSFDKGSDAIANGDVNFFIEESDDLGISDPWAAVVTQNAPNASAVISYSLPSGQPKVFARLKVVQVP